LDLLSTDLLWRGALAVIPLAIVVAVVCRYVPCRPSTRHALWLIVLGFFAAAPFLSQIQMPVPEFAFLSPSPTAPVTEVPSDPPPVLAASPYTQPQPPASALPKESFVEPDRSVAPGNPLFGKSVLPATATTSRMPHIPGAAPPAQQIPSPSPVLANVDMPKADKIAVSRAEPLQSELSRWAGYAVGIRDSVMGLPPIPAILWIGGLALLLIVTVLRIGRSMQMVRVAKLAPPRS